MTVLESMLKLMCLPISQFNGVCRTVDGHYLARQIGDIGYNHYLGRPAPPHAGPGRDFMLKVWKGLTIEERQDVLALAASPPDGFPILLHKDFGVPKEVNNDS